MDKLKKIDWKNLIERAVHTFIQTFISALIIVPSLEWNDWKPVLISAIASGLSAVKTLVVELMGGTK